MNDVIGVYPYATKNVKEVKDIYKVTHLYSSFRRIRQWHRDD